MYKKDISLSIGILGGGQLGKMLAQAGADWNLDLSVLDPTSSAPASCCAKQIIGDFRDYDTVMRFGADKDLITVEIEDVNLAALRDLQKKGKSIYPNPSSLELIQDKGLQKQFYKKYGFNSSNYFIVNDPTEVISLLKDGKIKLPFVQKLRKAGYDGKGVQIINNDNDLTTLLEAPSVIEEKIEIDKEIAVLAVRRASGQKASYEPVEMVFHPTANLLLYQECPANISENLKLKAKALAENLIEKMNIVGLLAVEMFLDKTGNLLINEVAPRPHNSGHHTIEAAVTSQYHQHLRAILDLPLGNTSNTSQSILLNILGEPGYSGKAIYKGLQECMSIEGVYIHLYGKQDTKPYRKMGHVTIVGNDKHQVRSIADQVTKLLKVIA